MSQIYKYKAHSWSSVRCFFSDKIQGLKFPNLKAKAMNVDYEEWALSICKIQFIKRNHFPVPLNKTRLNSSREAIFHAIAVNTSRTKHFWIVQKIFRENLLCSSSRPLSLILLASCWAFFFRRHALFQRKRKKYTITGFWSIRSRMEMCMFRVSNSKDKIT